MLGQEVAWKAGLKLVRSSCLLLWGPSVGTSASGTGKRAAAQEEAEPGRGEPCVALSVLRAVMSRGS